MKHSLRFIAVSWSFLIFLLFAGCASSGDRNCLQKQGALDIGSGSVKSVVAIVDVCRKQVLETVFEDSRAVASSEAFEKAGTGLIPANFIQTQLPVFRAMAEELRRQGAAEVTALATAVFRNARNGAEAAREIAAVIGGPVQIITQEEEARLGYWSALAQHPPAPDEALIVWDIGGGSMQMIRTDRDGEFEIYRGELAAVNFKNRVITEIQKQNPKEKTSPNPLGSGWKKAVALARDHAATHVPENFRRAGRLSTWLGIGGVLYNSVREQLGSPASYKAADLRKILEKKSRLNDREIGGDYAATDVTNLALVAGYMETLEIERVIPVKGSLARGWLLYRLSAGSQSPE